MKNKIPKVPKVKKISLKKAKTMAWDTFSEYIRRKYADNNGNVKCVTCGVIIPWKESQAGHFVDSRNNTVLYDERLVHPQDIRCNIFLKGNKVRYTVFMVRTYGFTMDQIEELDNLKLKSKNMKAYEHLEIRDKYLRLIQDLP